MKLSDVILASFLLSFTLAGRSFASDVNALFGIIDKAIEHSRSSSKAERSDNSDFVMTGEERREYADLVKRLQFALGKLGFYHSHPDGNRGPETRRAESEFRRAYGVRPFDITEADVRAVERYAEIQNGNDPGIVKASDTFPMHEISRCWRNYSRGDVEPYAIIEFKIDASGFLTGESNVIKASSIEDGRSALIALSNCGGPYSASSGSYTVELRLVGTALSNWRVGHEERLNAVAWRAEEEAKRQEEAARAERKRAIAEELRRQKEQQQEIAEQEQEREQASQRQRRRAEADERRQSLAEESERKGREFAALKRTSWKAAEVWNPLYDKKDVTAVSIQEADGVEAVIEIKCEERGIASITTTFRRPSDAEKVRISYDQTGVGGFLVTLRVNEKIVQVPADARSIDAYTVAAIVDQTYLDRVSAEHGDDGKALSLIKALSYGTTYMVDYREAWRLTSSVETNYGRMFTEVPLFQEEVRQAVMSCMSTGTSKEDRLSPSGVDGFEPSGKGGG